MKILVVSNLYPPYFIGGYEIACKTVTDELQKRGHQVTVLTSDWHATGDEREDHVWRVLHYFPRAQWRYLARIFFAERADYIKTKEVLQRCKFDCVFVWNFAGLSRSVLHLLQQHFNTITYNAFDYWMVGEFSNECLVHLFDNRTRVLPIGEHRVTIGPLRSLLRTLFAAFGVNGETPDLIATGKFIFNSEAILKYCTGKGFTPSHYKIIHGGIAKKEFPLHDGEMKSAPYKLLYVGRVVPEKGVHTAIEAVRTLIRNKALAQVTLTIAGDGDSAYINHLKNYINENNLASRVRLKGGIQRASIREEYLSHDILLFPSLWEEPFGLVILEAMACGVAVVATGTGGSSEILQNEYNCLLFSPGSSEECSRQVEKLIFDAQLLNRLRDNGKATVRNRFYLEDKVDEIEAYLMSSS
jgi:glycosyltransferase involved in cell wall biosynthesis